MATTRIRVKPGRKFHLYIAEWMEFRGLGDQKMADRIGVDRVTVTRWRSHQHRLTPDKIAAIATALDIEPQQLWRPPSRPSLDAIVKDTSDDLLATAVDIVTRLVRKAS